MSPRPFRNRKIMSDIVVDYYKPRGIPMGALSEVVLMPDEYEAIRLADFEEMYQADAAAKMGISRQTFGNIVKSAHKKIAEALIKGKAIKIECSTVKVPDIYTCSECEVKWENHDNETSCPDCKSENIVEVKKSEIQYRPGQGRRGRCGKIKN